MLLARTAAYNAAGSGDSMRELMLALPLLMLAACNDSPKVEAENASVAEVADKVQEAGRGDALAVRPGQWESSVELESINVPGMPPQAAEQMKKTMASVATGHKSCLTEDQARRPKEDFFAGTESSCRYDSFSMNGGKVTGTMLCTSPQGGGTQRIEFDGTYGAEEYRMRMASTVEGASPAGPMTMVMNMTSKRVGECDPKSAAS